MKISVQAPTMNEGENIKDWVRNVESIADEIVLIDNSSDDTIQIAKNASKKVRVINCKAQDFSEIRNKGLKSVKKGWYVLYLDTDEFLSKELIKNIKGIKEEELADVYLIKRRNYFKFDNSQACLTTRFIRGEPKLSKQGLIKFVNKFHERAVIIKQATIKELKGDTLHYPKQGKYDKGGKYMMMHIERVKKDKAFNKEIMVYLKQLIKYILIFDYHPRYWKGNAKLWFSTIRYLIDFIRIYKSHNNPK
ncbi:MAG: glycosyltransferase [Candidatus Nanoarchaeia archaeon]|jgi:hypothetical protein